MQFPTRQADESERIWPVGCIFVSVSSANPADLLGFGTWTAFGAGRCLVGFDAGDADFDAAEKTSGAKTVTLSEAQMPSHTHVQNAHSHVQSLPTAQTGGQSSGTRDTSTNGSGADALSTATTVAVNQNTGGGQAHPNVQPSITVFLWKRTA